MFFMLYILNQLKYTCFVIIGSLRNCERLMLNIVAHFLGSNKYYFHLNVFNNSISNSDIPHSVI